MRPESLAFLKRLLDTPGPSAFESAPARVWRTEAKTITGEVDVDVTGNSWARLNGAGTPRISLIRNPASVSNRRIDRNVNSRVCVRSRMPALP